MVNIFGIEFEYLIIGIFFWVVFISYIILDLIVIIVTVKKLIWEIKSVFSDLLKIIQYSAIIITFLDLIAMDLIQLIDSEIFNLVPVKLATDLCENFLLYYIFNQLSWYFLILHINKSRQLTQGINYKNIRIQIQSQERKTLLIFTIFYVWLKLIYLIDQAVIEYLRLNYIFC